VYRDWCWFVHHPAGVFSPGQSEQGVVSEGACQPMRMAVRDGIEYVYAHHQAPLLFDLGRDPSERCNCVGDPAYAARLAELKQLVHEGWDAEEMRARVLESQRQRVPLVGRGTS
jgi:arylsulfatase A-like enzyme